MINVKKVFLIIILFSYIALADDIIVIDYVINKDDTVEITTVDVKSGKISIIESTSDEYQIQIINSKGTVLKKINIPVIFYVPDLGETNSSDGTQRIEWNPAADKFQFLHNGNVIHEIDLKDVVCNKDSVCDQYETPENCPRDCKPKQEGFNVVLILGALLIGFGIILLYFFIQRRNAKREAEIMRERRLQ